MLSFKTLSKMKFEQESMKKRENKKRFKTYTLNRNLRNLKKNTKDKCKKKEKHMWSK